MIESIALPVWSGSLRRGVERIPAERDGDGVRLLGTPGVADGLAAGDVVRLIEAVPGFELVRRGGNFGVWIWFEDSPAPDLIESARQQAEQLGGRLEGGTMRSVILTIPSSAGFETIGLALDAWTALHPQAVWEFTNAYAVDGETPLDWWR